jgi:GT2 family glycosyltransferase
LLATVIIPFHRDRRQLAQSLPAARLALPNAEIIVAADGAIEDCRDLARASSAEVIEIAGPLGPAVARNRAAAKASGDVLVFVDADVIAAPDSLSGLCGVLEREPDVAAAFGAYDLKPPQPNFMSQYKNLSHACVHELGNPEAGTFWAGLGVVRTKVFREVSGFDERFRRPSVEDIDLGYRIRRAGHRLRLDPRFRGTHLKKWTIKSSIVIDITARGIPWTQLIHRYGALSNDLNTRHELRWSVVLAYLLALSVVAMPFVLSVGLLSFAALAALAALIVLNRSYYQWFLKRKGWAFTARVVPAHILYHLCNGVSFVAGTLLHLGTRMGLDLPGSLPEMSWPIAIREPEAQSPHAPLR